jgi:ferredoxin
MITFINRSAKDLYFDKKFRAMVDKIDNCRNCGLCAERCPYHLAAPTQLKEQQVQYYRMYDAYWKSKRQQADNGSSIE